jgi:hypothetical protein
MTASSPYRDLTLGTWRSLLVLAVTFHAVRARLRRLYDMGRQTGPIRTVLDQLAMAAQEASTYGADEEDEDAVKKAVMAWDANLDAALGLRTLEPDARKLLTEVRRLVSHFVVRDPFQALFVAVEELARDVYGEAWPPAELSVAHTNSHPHPGARTETDPYTVTALTLWPPNTRESKVGKTKVELVVYCDEFGPAAFAALPMLLTHECVCHVPARQDKAKNDSTFAEGFMDWAACRFLQQWAGALDPDLASAARWHANRLTGVLTQPSYGGAAEMRRRGHEAAEVLFSWFEEECHLHPDEAGPRVARLAVELNQVDNSIQSKDHFVSLLEDPFPPALDDLLRRWVAEEIDTGQLFAATLSSFPSHEKQS